MQPTEVPTTFDPKSPNDRFQGIPNNVHVIVFKEDLLKVCLQIAFGGTDAGNPSDAILEDS